MQTTTRSHNFFIIPSRKYSFFDKGNVSRIPLEIKQKYNHLFVPRFLTTGPTHTGFVPFSRKPAPLNPKTTFQDRGCNKSPKKEEEENRHSRAIHRADRDESPPRRGGGSSREIVRAHRLRKRRYNALSVA